jgi:hypothetical protein
MIPPGPCEPRPRGGSESWRRSLALWSIKQEKPLDRLRPAKNFLEERHHRFPRPRVRQHVVGYPRHAHAVGVRIGEAVHRAAIANDLPVRLRCGHLLRQGVDLRRRDKRIIGAGADEDLRLDLPGHGGP